LMAVLVEANSFALAPRKGKIRPLVIDVKTTPCPGHKEKRKEKTSPAKLRREGEVEGNQKVAVQKIIEVLEARARPFFPEDIEGAIERCDLGVEESLEGLTREVMAEGVRRSVGALRKFSDVFQVPLPLLEVEKALRERGVVLLETTSGVKNPGLKVEFRRAYGKTIGEVVNTLHLPLSDLELPSSMELCVWPGLSYLRLGHSLKAVRGRAFFIGRSEEETEKTAQDIKALAPFLPAMDLGGLAEAFDALMELENNEAKVEGPHILARGVDSWALRRGPILGDPELDKALLAEREVQTAEK